MSGGVERSTWNLFQGLQERFLHTCHVLYDRRKFEITNPLETIVQIPQSDKQQQIDFIRQYLIEHQIQIIVIQGIYDKLTYFYEAAQKNIPILYVFRGEPAFPYKTWTIEYIYSLIKYRGLKSWGKMRLIKFPLRKMKLRYELYRRNQQIDHLSNYFIFLSQHYVKTYKWYSFEDISKRSFVIPNAICYENTPLESKIKQKQKHVVLVARFEEFTKRIIYALKIWNLVQTKYHLTDWILDIVGDGEDKDMYENYLLQNPTSNIVFHGYQEPIEYYKKAAICILTSRSEAFANVLVEAQVFGCVPIAFNSYAAVSDIITHKNNGFIIKNGDINAFAKTLYQLAIDNERRYRMAYTAMLSVEKFSKEKVLNLWDSTLTKIIKQQAITKD